MIAKFAGKCRRCSAEYAAGTNVRYSNLTKQVFCLSCWGAKNPATSPVEIPQSPAEQAGAVRFASERLAARMAEIQAERESNPFEVGKLPHSRFAPGYTPEAAAYETATSPAPATSLAAVIAAAVQEHLSLGAPALDTDAIREMIRAECATYAPAPTVIEYRAAEREPVTIEGAHYLMPRVLKLLAAGVHLYLWGPAGTGKTTIALQAAHAVRGTDGGEVDTIDPSTPRSAILGYRNIDKSPAETAFSRCWERGVIYIPDECDNGPAHVQTLYNTALANGRAPLAWGSTPKGEGFGFIGTGNTPGRPTAQFPDRKPMSAAFADRLYFIHVPLDPSIECRAAGLRAPAPMVREGEGTTCTPAEWVRWVQRVREWAATNAPTMMVTPRASLTGLLALSLGETPIEVAHGLVFRGADASLVGKVLAACPLPV